MDNQKADKTDEMVRMTLKLANDSTKDARWICKKIYHEPESAPRDNTVLVANRSLPIDDGYSNEETENNRNRSHENPSSFGVKLKVVKNQLPSRSQPSTKHDANSFKTYYPTCPQENVDSSNNSCTATTNLSVKDSSPVSRYDAISNVFHKNPIGTQASKSTSLENHLYDPNALSVPRGNKFVQNKVNRPFPIDMTSTKIPPVRYQIQRYSKDVVAIARGTIPSISQNFSMTIHRNPPVTSGCVRPGNLDIIAQDNTPDILKREVARPLEANDKHFSVGTTKYGHSSHESYFNANQNFSLAQEPISNATSGTIKNVFHGRIADGYVNLPQNSTGYLKRPLTSQVHVYSLNTHQSVNPPKKKRSHTETIDSTLNCDLCNATYKSRSCYSKHFSSEKHLRNVNRAVPRQPYLYDFMPNYAIRPIGPMNVQAQPPSDYMLNLMSYQMWQHRFQTLKIANQSGGTTSKLSNTDVQKIYTGAYESDKPFGYSESQNDLRRDYYNQDPRLVNQSGSHTSNLQGISLPPNNHRSENSMMAFSKCLEKKDQSNRASEDSSSEIQLKKSSAVCFKKPDVPPVPCHQKDFFRVYHCMICSVFQTNYLDELEKHICADRSRQPLEMIVNTNKGLYCKLCGFRTNIFEQMAPHCATEYHLIRVEYYNHVMEGNRNEKLNNLQSNFLRFLIFCSACEISVKSLDYLKRHNADPRHRHYASCCMYIASFNKSVQYCQCNLCGIRTDTKDEFLIHVRSQVHWNTLRMHSSNDITLLDPKSIFFIKEANSVINELPRNSIQLKANTFIERETLCVTETQASVDSTLTSLQSLPVSCPLCQQLFPEINVLEQHLHQKHDVNEAGVKWLISTISSGKLNVPEGKISQSRELANANKLQNIVFSPHKSSAFEKPPARKMSIASVSYQTAYIPGRNVENEPSECLREVKTGQNVENEPPACLREVATGKNVESDSPVCPRKVETGQHEENEPPDCQREVTTGQNVESEPPACPREDTLKQNVENEPSACLKEVTTGNNVKSEPPACPRENTLKQNVENEPPTWLREVTPGQNVESEPPARLREDTSEQNLENESHVCPKEVTSGQNVERKSPTCLSEVTYRRNVKNESSACLRDVTSEKNVTINSIQERIKCKETSHTSQSNESKGIQNSLSIDENPRVSPYRKTSASFPPSNHVFNIESVRNASVADQNLYSYSLIRINKNSPRGPQASNMENIWCAEEERDKTAEKLNPSSTQEEILTDSESKLNEHDKLEIETDDSLSEHLSASDHGSSISQPDRSSNRERNASVSSDQGSSISQSDFSTDEEKNASFSSDHGLSMSQHDPSSNNERHSPFSSDHGSPIYKSDISSNRERNTSVPNDRGSSISHSDQSPNEKRNSSLSSDHGSPMSQVYPSSNNERSSPLSSDHGSPISQSDSNDNSAFSSDHGSPISQSDSSPNSSFSSDHSSVTKERQQTTYDSSSEHSSENENGLPISQSDTNCGYSSNRDVSVTYKKLLEKMKQISSAEKSVVNPLPSLNYSKDYQNRSSPFTDQPNVQRLITVGNNFPSNRPESNRDYVPNSEHRKSTSDVQIDLNLRTYLNKDSDTSNLMVLEEVQQKVSNDILVITDNSDDSMTSQMNSDDSSVEYSSPETIDAQIQTKKHIENIEFSNAFSKMGSVNNYIDEDEESLYSEDIVSLTDCVDNSNDSDDDEKNLDIEGIVYADLEEL